MYKGVIEKYRKFLPVSERTPVITLLEGNTPLLEANNLELQNVKLYLKYEGVNPTGSFKDRGMTVAISKAKEEGAKAVICASTGNTSASAAAYAAKAGLRCIVIVPAGYIALGKLSQAIAHGAEVLQIEGNFDRALSIVKEISKNYPVTLVNSLNPYRLEGQKTAAFEICDILNDAPDFQAMPVGNAGNITAYWKGYKEYKEKNIIKNLPVMLGFQAAKSAPLVEGRPVKNPQTIATAIRIGNPASWEGAIRARDESGGLIEKVTDREILNSYKLLATREGIFVEPASAASLAGVLKLYKQGYFKKFLKNKKEIKIVCILTGHGLKDPDRALSLIKKTKILPADLKKIVKYLGF